MISLLDGKYTLENYKWLLSALHNAILNKTWLCNPDDCTDCQYRRACQDLKRFEEYLKNKCS